jgi:hypothetical protein
LLADADDGMERQGRLLKDQSDSAAADLAEFFGLGLEKVAAFIKDGTLFDLAIRGKKPQDRRRERALAGSGFAEDA